MHHGQLQREQDVWHLRGGHELRCAARRHVDDVGQLGHLRHFDRIERQRARCLRSLIQWRWRLRVVERSKRRLRVSTTTTGVYGETTRPTAPVYMATGTTAMGLASPERRKARMGYTAAYAVFAQSDGSPYIFYGYDTQTKGVCNIDPDANLSCTGAFSSGGPMLTRQRSAVGHRVLTYASQSATPTIEDLGAAQMHNGIANVEIPADFASVIDRSNPYYVFLTPMGDTGGLYVSRQNSGGFQVRENMHGRSNVTFQYRIIGVPLGAKNLRLPAAPEMKPPRLPKLGSSTR